MRNEHKILIGTPELKRLGQLGRDERMILRLTLKK
jgi:hypothetical protein